MSAQVATNREPEPAAGFERRFPNTGADFSGWHAARDWLKANGYSVGQMQGAEPMGILKGDFWISKWRRLDSTQRDALDGRITWNGLSPRNGPAVVTLKAAPQ